MIYKEIIKIGILMQVGILAIAAACLFDFENEEELDQFEELNSLSAKNHSKKLVSWELADRSNGTFPPAAGRKFLTYSQPRSGRLKTINKVSVKKGQYAIINLYVEMAEGSLSFALSLFWMLDATTGDNYSIITRDHLTGNLQWNSITLESPFRNEREYTIELYLDQYSDKVYIDSIEISDNPESDRFCFVDISTSTSEDPMSSLSTPEDPGSSTTTSEDPGSSISTSEDPGSSITTSEDPGSSITTSEDPGSSISTSEEPGSTSDEPGSTITTPEDPGSTSSTPTTTTNEDSTTKDSTSTEFTTEDTSTPTLPPGYPDFSSFYFVVIIAVMGSVAFISAMVTCLILKIQGMKRQLKEINDFS